MKTVIVKGIEIGAGKPKICVPIVGITKEEIIKEAKTFKDIAVDVLEWRVDWFEHAFDSIKVNEVLKKLAAVLPNTPILFTFRTANEGGEKAITPEAYVTLYKEVIAAKYADLVDVELYIGDNEASQIIAAAKAADVKVVMSNHDFDKTPSKEVMLERLIKMQDMNTDIAKIAVMPNTKRDVLTLLDMTLEMQEEHARVPLITMSMAGLGAISRVAGETFGSALTFGCATKASAPGQIEVAELENVLTIMHKSLGN